MTWSISSKVYDVVWEMGTARALLPGPAPGRSGPEGSRIDSWLTCRGCSSVDAQIPDQ